MFLSEPLMLSQQISREHFGWDEWNDWWFYEPMLFLSVNKLKVQTARFLKFTCRVMEKSHLQASGLNSVMEKIFMEQASLRILW